MPGDQESERGTSDAFTSMAAREPKNRRSQVLVIVVLLVTIVGGFLAIGGQLIGFVLLVGGLVALIGLTIWAVRNWDWAR